MYSCIRVCVPYQMSAYKDEVHGEALHEQGCEAGTSSSTEGVENEESLQTSALVGQFPDSVEN
ncbi:hypothetical protein L798_07017 [Zootermopsis nevadensis]|uniref:Uncharacterized protein n=1 Tax=Zootermopsis nevadensis TaxID=136037 RepID=A0A067R645_ZOONE|nr:hypothetical protein L798_07017 [Zootermopsis nevadensis]